MALLGGWGAVQRWLKAVGGWLLFLCCVIRCAVCIIETHNIDGVQTFLKGFYLDNVHFFGRRTPSYIKKQKSPDILLAGSAQNAENPESISW